MDEYINAPHCLPTATCTRFSRSAIMRMSPNSAALPTTKFETKNSPSSFSFFLPAAILTFFHFQLFVFAPRELRNLVLMDEANSLAPITGCQIADMFEEDTPQFYATCGRGSISCCFIPEGDVLILSLILGAKSSMRMLKHGLDVTEMAVTDLPGNANAIWTVKKHISGTLCFQVL